MGAWLRFEKKAWGVHKSLQLHLLDQEHHGLWLGSKDIKVDYLMCVCVQCGFYRFVVRKTASNYK